jgi:hypothetical protein
VTCSPPTNFGERSRAKTARQTTTSIFQRRIRTLRDPRDGWQIASAKDDKSLPHEHYRVDFIGWHPGLGVRAKAFQRPSKATRTRVFLRDGSRCQICGISDGEPYPDDPNRCGIMTVGHILAQDRGGSNEESNLRVECALCNEPLRAEGRDPESLSELVSALRTLRKDERRRLGEWLAHRHRTRDKLDETYDRARRLPSDDYLSFIRAVQQSF